MYFSRRTFFRKCLKGAGYILIFLLLPVRLFRKAVGRGTPAGSVMHAKDKIKKGKFRVAVEPCSSYDPGVVYHSVKAALDSISFSIPRKKKILLKPNIMAQNTPEQAASTHPALIDALCRIFIENDCRVTIGDSSAFYQGGSTRLGFETTGMAAVAKKYGAKLLSFEATLLEKVTTGKVLNPFYITRAVFEHDLLVNVPKMKIHRLARYTGAIKNIYGCVAGGTKQVYHRMYLDRPDYREVWGKPLVDVFEAVNPGLNVMDAVIGLDKDGPAANGEPKFTGLILAAENACALDITACRIMGFDPFWVPAVREAIERGMASPEKVITAGNIPLVPYVQLPDGEPKRGLSKKLDNYIFDQFIVEPRVNDFRCDKCGDCAQKCAPGAIDFNRKGYPRVDYKKCIFCYCCEEYCPRGAVYLHGSAVNHLIRGVRQIMRL